MTSAVSHGRSWQDVLAELGLSGSGSSTSTVRAHALRLGLDTRRLAPAQPEPTTQLDGPGYDPTNLRSAGSLFAACWFTLRGMQISWPLEPCRYDIVAEIDGAFQRVQVKTTTGIGPSADVTVSNSRRQGAVVYAPGEIDAYFVIDGELTAYLIPYEVVAGYRALRLGRYVNFKIIDRGALLTVPASP